VSDEMMGPLERRLSYEVTQAMMTTDAMADLVEKGMAGEAQAEGETPIKEVVMDFVLPILGAHRRCIMALAREVDRLNAVDPSDDTP